ncbi:amino acid adenylation domain-containing protein [Pseudorhodobacter turbinis]|uniref:Amino acid adenylation domain-containing protein n=1 Tax=Pseudorhodobacter turbinis TaxID=2500533 RepID=A0A4P8EFU2_9RHOB|nr:non-ribosomal peptide synthetase [Pseudorhodobacter turbinis]QCO55738.1 amino acid adenylation domain-containing protein [Pseudorhodobacter turbinis]
MSPQDTTTLDPAAKRALLAKMLKQAAPDARPRHAPLSSAQHRLWFIDQLQPGQSTYTIAAALRLRGALDLTRLQAALDAIVVRHEPLRTRFTDHEGAVLQTIGAPAPVALETADIAEPALQDALAGFAARPFDLTKGPVLRAALFRMDNRHHVLAIAVHHIVADYHSLQVMIAEFTALYEGKTLPPLPLQFADYALAQRGHNRTGQVAFWQEALHGLAPLLDMPTDFMRPKQQDYVGARLRFDLPEGLASRLRSLAKARAVTPFTLLLAGFHILHQRYSGTRDVCIGTTVSNRGRAELQGLVGYFVNTLAIRCTVAEDDSFDDFLARMQGHISGAMAHQEVPFEQVVDATVIERSLAHAPLFQSMFNLHEKQPNAVRLTGLTLETLTLPAKTARFDLCLDMFIGEKITGVLEYATALFRPETAQRMVDDYIRILEAVIEAPQGRLADIDLFTAADKEALLAFNATDRTIPEPDLASLIAQGTQQPDATAVIAGNTRLTHAQLDAAANRLAQHLGDRVQTGDRVAVCLPRTADLVVTLLALLKLGAPYIPLDPTHPPQRLRDILQDSNPALLIGTGAPPVPSECLYLDLEVSRDDINACADKPPLGAITGEDLAYVIFTSGTTGRPKGVPIRQRSLVNLLTSMMRSPGMTAQDCLVSVTTPAFDIAGLELFLPLLSGGTLVIADQFDVIDGLALSRLLERVDATVMQATPSTWRLLVEEGWQAPKSFKMLCGGEALDIALARRLLAGDGRLFNLYGPTETTIWSACAEITAGGIARGQIPLGRPVANTWLHIGDADGRPCPPGVAGEILIGGDGLSPGYLDRPELTAQKFITRDGQRLYRTGDRAKMTAEGEIIYLGRTDFQLKLRGFRIEAGEIETLLTQYPAVEQAAVTLLGDGDTAMLVAYCRAAAEPDLQDRLRAHLGAHLPAYMIPSAFVFLDRFPLNASGKVDRLRLPAPETQSTPQAPTTGAEAMLAKIWAEVLGIDAPGPEDDFFGLGGHSLLAMRMVARLGHDGPRAVPLRLLFENPRLAAYARALEQAGILRDVPRDPIPRLASGAKPPLSHAQSRQWALASLDPDQTAYHISSAQRLKGTIDSARLARAFAALCDRHQILRSAYPATGGTPQHAAHCTTDPSFCAEPVTEDALPSVLLAKVQRPFDITNGPLVTLDLLSVDAENHVLLMVMHHIIADAASVQLALGELMECYNALTKDPAWLPAPLPLQYADYAAWQADQDFSEGCQYWVDHLRGAPPLLELPTDFPRPAQQDFSGGNVDFTLSGAALTGLRALATQTGATPYMVLLAGFTAFLGRFAETDDVVVGTPISTRPHPDLDQLIGMFVNTLALRLRMDDKAGFTALLDVCRQRVLDGFGHQDTPFEKVVEALAPDRTWSHNPVFQAMFSWRVQAQRPAHEGPEWAPLAMPTTSAKMDLHLAVLDRGHDLALRLEYRRDLFLPETASNMAQSFEALILSILDAPDAPINSLSMLHPEQSRAIARWNDTGQLPVANTDTLHGLVAACAAQVPTRVAVRDTSGALSYDALEARSNTLAAYLQGRGIGAGDRVGVALGRGVDLVVAILGVLKTGAAYVPLDPNYPVERIAYVAEDAALSLILGDRDAANTLGLAGFWEGRPPQMPTPCVTTQDDLAYLIYTSGSTGKPKGVALNHGNAVALVRWAERTFSKEELAGVLGSTSVCFDLSVFEIFATLSLGGTLFMVEDLFALPSAPFAEQVTLINTVPTPMAELIRLGPLPKSVRTVCLAGETPSPALARKMTEAVDRFVHLYGPSEDTTFSTGMDVPRGFERFNLGHPVAGTQAYILDALMQQLPVGMPGELYLAGQGVGRGYWNRPGMSAERFLPNPFDHDGSAPVMYRTGDRVRRTSDGSIDYFGRGDRQLKIRGFRIEPGEVEAALSTLDGVTAAVVDLWQVPDRPARLTAWVEGDALQSDLVAELTKRLPAHLVPTQFVIAASLPRLPNGKLDRKSMPAPSDSKPMQQAGDEMPLPGLEQQLAGIWKRVLGREAITRNAGFFSIGGDSILAIQVVAEARDLGIALTPRDLFQFPTLAELAAAAVGRETAGQSGGPVIGPQPMTPVQHWFLNRDLPQAQHWNQAVVVTPTRPLKPDTLDRALGHLSEWHASLRARFTCTDGAWEQIIAPVQDQPYLTRTSGDVGKAAQALQQSFDLADGPMWGAALCDHADGGQRLVVVAHHLLVDGVSWRILMADLQRLYSGLERGETPTRRRSTPTGTWASHLQNAETFTTQRDYWQDVLSVPSAALPVDTPDGQNTEATAKRHETRLDSTLSQQVLQDVPAAYPVTSEELMLTSLALALRDWTGQAATRIEMESHGRIGEDQIDLSGTVGWLTAIYPFVLSSPPDGVAHDALRSVKEALRTVPSGGIGYGVLRYLHNALPDTETDIRFNYLGQAGAVLGADSLFQPADESAGPARAVANPCDTLLEINALATPDGLRIGWNYAGDMIATPTIEQLATDFTRHLIALVAHCLGGEDTGLSPVDFPDMDFAADDLDDLLQSL